MAKVAVVRVPIVIKPSPDRVLIRPFIPGDENRCFRIMARIAMMSKEEVHTTLAHVLADFTHRHLNTKQVLLQHYENVSKWNITDRKLTEDQRLLIGACFTQEYSLESSALFNPSIVVHPDQTNLPEGAVRFIMSLRAIGEGHISSIVFREGTVEQNGKITIRTPEPHVTEPEHIPTQEFDKELFNRKLDELNINTDFKSRVMEGLHDVFSLSELIRQTEHIRRLTPPSSSVSDIINDILGLAYSNYTVSFRPEQRTSEKAIFPSSPSQRNGIEDVRLVRFTEDDGSCCYYGTYTAYDGHTVFPQMIETDDFVSFRFLTLNGPAARNKGMALFPRKINGLYTMLSRQDNENLFLMYSDNIHFWYEPETLMRPAFPWEVVQIGNCGSPIETDAGWLVLSHGVGPMRKYCVGAFLLDKDDPSKVIGRLREPLIEPTEGERGGYVPNVIYTCGALPVGDRLLIPYAMSDYATSFAFASIADILHAME